jgi:hypothetical protein
VIPPIILDKILGLRKQQLFLQTLCVSNLFLDLRTEQEFAIKG